MAFEYLADYATFQSVEDMDHEINNRIKTLRFDLTKSERAIVFAIKSHCLDYPGACHLKNETIATTVGVSLITVSRAISKLVKLAIIGKANRSKRNGIKGANIYFFLPQNDVSDMTHRDTVVEASNDEGSEVEVEDLSIKSFNLLKTSTTNIISNSITELENLALQAEKKKAYMNEYQQMLFDFLHTLPFVDAIKDELHKIVLCIKMNGIRDFINAKDVFMNIIRDISNRTLTITNTLRSVFKGAYDNATARKSVMPSATKTVEDKPEPMKKVAFYDWLEERPEAYSSEVGQMNIQNWLEW